MSRQCRVGRAGLAALVAAIVMAGGSASAGGSAPAGGPRGAASSHPGLLFGIGDQKPDMFGDPRFLRLRIRYARMSIPWDAVENRAQSRRVAIWLGEAHRAGVTPLISFDHSILPRRHRYLPSAKRMRWDFRIFRARFPWVIEFATWNEANFCGEPTCHRPALVAAYFRGMRAQCRRCHLLGAEMLDLPNMVSWVRQFRHAAGADTAWGLHNYIGANRLQTASTRALLHSTGHEIWLTETAGVVARRNRSPVRFPESAAHAARVTRFIFDRLASLSPRITRLYLYEWNIHTRREPWDSALIGPDDRTRPAFRVVEQELARRAAKPANIEKTG